MKPPASLRIDPEASVSSNALRLRRRVTLERRAPAFRAWVRSRSQILAGTRRRRPWRPGSRA